MEKIAENKAFGGWHRRYRHTSQATGTEMTFAVYLPPGAHENARVPVVYWLSGLTCTDENFMQKAGAMRVAAELGLAIVAPDTSPRGEGVADDPEGSYDLGLGAGFYVNATEQPWQPHYQMYDYVTQELVALVEANLPVTDAKSICGHSMGGHGALVIGLREAGAYSSVSAFSPICNPSQVPWGKKALAAYLGDDTAAWANYDATELLKNCEQVPPLKIEQGDSDEFLVEQLSPQAFLRAADEKGVHVQFGLQKGYDHSYYFIASFIEEHLYFHAMHLRALG